MKRWNGSFNIFFAAFLSLLIAGCAAVKEGEHAVNPKKEQSTIRLYLEGQKADRTTSGTVMVTSNRFLYTVERDPFLDEADLSKATLVDHPDGTFSIQLTFDDHGALLLDMYTASHKGKHIVIFSQFPDPDKKKEKHKKKKKEEDDSDIVESSGPPQASASTNSAPRESGWLAAVLIRDRISNGVFRFTPDASRPEGLRIVRGLRNILKDKKKDN